MTEFDPKRTGPDQTPHSLTPEKVKRLLPQGDRFRFVSEVLEYEPGKRILARLADLEGPEFDYLKDHMPGNPFIPGTILQEALEQAGSLIIADSIPENSFAFLRGIDKFRWYGFVGLDEEVLLEAKIITLRSNAGKASLTATRSGEIVASGRVIFGIGEKPQLA